MTGASTMLVALLVEWRFGWPDRLYRTLRHPVVWIGALISWCEQRLNLTRSPPTMRYLAGALTTIMVVVVSACGAWGVQETIRALIGGPLPITASEASSPASQLGSIARAFAAVLVTGAVASSLMAARSLRQHVEAVQLPLGAGDLEGARHAVAQVVGRDIESLDSPAVARASIETLAESTCDGVVAPLFWGVLFGLPGIAAYKAINTLDSMIGHRNDRFLAFGGFAARLDDIANWVPARLTALLIVAVAHGRRKAAFTTALHEAGRHRSPNAGWPESATAGMLNVRLSGPRQYGGRSTTDPWINGDAPDPDGEALATALARYRGSIERVLVPTLVIMAALTELSGGPFGHQ